ncbi:hypothetical protein FGRMN_6519 [Fusarium graminum]|nr:hypothetical protein FGRMN_6519 [Fusarium graminum]
MEKLLDDDVEMYRCQPSDTNVRVATEHVLSACDLLMTNVHTRMTIYYQLPRSNRESRQDIVQRLKTGLEKLASQVPCLTATITIDSISKRGLMKTAGDDDAILLLVRGAETVSPDLPSFAHLERERFAPWVLPKGKIYPDALINPVPLFEGQDEGLPACVFQVNFIEGGLILTTAIHHFVADGPSIDLLFQAWAAHCRDGNYELWTDRTILSGPNSPDEVDTQELERIMVSRGCKVDSTQADPDNPWSNFMAEPTKSAIVSFSGRAIASLKSQVKAQSQSISVSTSDCLHAVLWAGLLRAKTTMLKDKVEGESWAIFPVNFRTHRIPEFPANYIGNASFLNGVVLPIEQLKGLGGPHQAAIALRRTIQNVDSAYLSDGKAWANSIQDPSTRTWLTNPPRAMDTAFASWASLTSYHTWDLGFGRPVALRPAPQPLPFVIVLPVKTDKDGDDLFEVNIVATEETHRILMADTGFRQYVSDYYLEVQE